MKRPKTISFDLDGTLVDHSFSSAIWREAVPRLVASARGMTLEEAKWWVLSQYDQVGESSLEWYDLSYWYRRFCIEEDWRETLASHRHLIRTFPEVEGVLRRLSRDYELIIISNASRPFIEEEISHSGLRSIPFVQVISATSDWAAVKKTPEFYQKVCERLRLDPSEMVHVGDHREFDFFAPQGAGIRSYLLDRTGCEDGDHVVRDLVEFVERALNGLES